MVTENDIGKIAYNFRWDNGFIENGVLNCRYYGYSTQFFIIKQTKDGFKLHYVLKNQTFVKKREFMSFLKKNSHFSKKFHDKIMLKDLFRKIKDL